jgi:hypothetical protein
MQTRRETRCRHQAVGHRAGVLVQIQPPRLRVTVEGEMQRRHSLGEESLLKRWKRLAKLITGDWTLPISRKRHPLDCGQTRCPICHSVKLDGRQSTRQERIADLRMREQDA